MGDPIYIAGPTAAGKSSIAVEIAQTLGGEIVSVDSMQVYRRMDKGTAKPTTTERASVPHHLIDIIEPSEDFDAARFVERVEEVLRRKKRVILCGGTGLYFKALLEGLGEAPGANERLRAELEDMDSAALLAELEKNDPETFGKIDRQNRRRLVRAVETRASRQLRLRHPLHRNHRRRSLAAGAAAARRGAQRDARPVDDNQPDAGRGGREVPR